MHNTSRSSTDFLSAFRTLISNACLGAILRHHGPTKRSPARVSASCIVKALVFHLLRGTGTVTENLQLLHQEKLSPSSMSERRANLPFKVFQTILGSALRPKAQEETHPEAFYKSWRLVGIDGTQFSVSNTPLILTNLTKAASRRMKAAFAKVGAAVLVELGVHNPLAVEIGQKEESEMVLSKRLLARLPAKCVAICDRDCDPGRIFSFTQRSWCGNHSERHCGRTFWTADLSECPCQMVEKSGILRGIIMEGHPRARWRGSSHQPGNSCGGPFAMDGRTSTRDHGVCLHPGPSGS